MPPKSIEAAVADGSLPPSISTQGDAQDDAQNLATTLYQLWLGARLRAKITRDRVPLDTALKATYALLNLDADFSFTQERMQS